MFLDARAGAGLSARRVAATDHHPNVTLRRWRSLYSLGAELMLVLQEALPPGGKIKTRDAEREEPILSGRGTSHEPLPEVSQRIAAEFCFHESARASVWLRRMANAFERDLFTDFTTRLATRRECEPQLASESTKTSCRTVSGHRLNARQILMNE